MKTLQQFCNEFQDDSITVSYYTAGMDQVALDNETEIQLYRIVQEVFNNIRKHAGADHIKVNLTASHPTVILQIKDNGKGFELNKRKKELIYEKRMGLKIIEERIGLINGTYKIQSKPSVGTLVHLEIPYIQN